MVLSVKCGCGPPARRWTPRPNSLRESCATTTHEGTNMNVRGATVLVTGANRGIGAAYTRAFLDAGAAKVYGAARDPASVTDADVVPVRMDVTNETEVAAAAEWCPDVNIVVNNAGIGFAVSALSTKVATRGRAMFDTHVFGILNVAGAFAPIIDGNGGGALINVSSIASWRSSSTLALYAASKSATWFADEQPPPRSRATRHPGRRRSLRLRRHRSHCRNADGEDQPGRRRACDHRWDR